MLQEGTSRLIPVEDIGFTSTFGNVPAMMIFLTVISICHTYKFAYLHCSSLQPWNVVLLRLQISSHDLAQYHWTYYFNGSFISCVL
jgi:hypothetical protein